MDEANMADKGDKGGEKHHHGGGHKTDWAEILGKLAEAAAAVIDHIMHRTDPVPPATPPPAAPVVPPVVGSNP